MNTMENEMSIKELNLEDMNEVNGGWNWAFSGLISIVGGTVGGLGAGVVALAASGPVGWAILGGAAVGAAVTGIAGGFYEGD